MGACWFTERSAGPTAVKAYEAQVEQDYYEYGHAGYTGTLCEKVGAGTVHDLYEFVEFPKPEGLDSYDIAHAIEASLMDNDFPDLPEEHQLRKLFPNDWEQVIDLADDKWEKAICWEMDPKETGGQKEYMFCGKAST